MKQPAGLNRNLDFPVAAFNAVLDKATIQSTSILNGAFMELLLGRMPLLDMTHKRVSYVGDAESEARTFTTMEQRPPHSRAAAAIDSDAPNVLRIAG